MSLSDNKRGVFTTIGAYTSLNQQPKPPKASDLYPSINNSKETIPYLLDVLKTIAGTEALKEVVGGMLTKLVDKVEPQLKTGLKKQFTHSNSGDAAPASFNTNGINVPVKNIDTNGKLKVSPDSSSGNLLYNKTTPNFDSVAHNAIINAGTAKSYNGMSVTYNATTDYFNVKPTTPITNIGDFFTNYIDKSEIINKKEIVSNLMDSIYGTLAKKNNKTIQEINDELLLEKQLEQAISGVDDPFVILPQDLADIEKQAQEMAAGVVNYDMGCGMMPASLDFSDLNNLIQSISGSTDPFAVSNVIEGTIDQSTSGTTAGAATSTANKQTIKDGFFQKLIKKFSVKMLAAVTTNPQIRVMVGMMSALENNGNTNLSQPKDDIKKQKIFIMCLAKEILILLGEFIFALAIAYLVKLLTPIIKKIIKEKINQYVGIIKSLTGVSKLIDTVTQTAADSAASAPS